MKNLFLIFICKLITSVSKVLNLGAGSTWPGHIALKVNPQIFSQLAGQINKGIILVAGTNGKTTTSKLIREVIDGTNEKKVITNENGANLLNGITSALINGADLFGKISSQWGVFEVDEATLPQVISNFQFPIFKNKRIIIVLLDLFRDQLDRYGEVDIIADKWKNSLKDLPSTAAVILNADDPQIAFIGQNLRAKVLYFGLNDPSIFLSKMQHAVDSTYCPKCGEKLEYEGIYFSHLGIWKCQKCGLTRPKPDLISWNVWGFLAGVYNRYNIMAAVMAAKSIGIIDKDIEKGIENFKPAFGRQEEIEINGKKIKILLSKNPAGFNESIRTLKDFPEKEKVILLVLNDRIPDGKDVSWIWDIDTEELEKYSNKIIVSGDRALDMGLRIKYSSSSKFKIEKDLKKAISVGAELTKKNATLYILATYSAMLEVRKIIGGRKLL